MPLSTQTRPGLTQQAEQATHIALHPHKYKALNVLYLLGLCVVCNFTTQISVKLTNRARTP